MKSVMLGMLAETSVHPGSGRNLGVVDLPVAREAATGYPVVVGSSLKGALRDKGERLDQARAEREFGRQDRGGRVLVSDGRLLLLPVRSLSGASRWVTCPQLIERYSRDRMRVGLSGLSIPSPAMGEALTSAEDEAKSPLFLEERQFKVREALTGELVTSLQELIRHSETQGRLPKRLVVLHDDDFGWFANYGLSIQARNTLDKEGNKTSKNLWYEESLPPDTVMYTMLLDRDDRAESDDVVSWLFPDTDPYLQVGGNETVGHGWFAVRRVVAAERAVSEVAA